VVRLSTADLARVVSQAGIDKLSEKELKKIQKDLTAAHKQIFSNLLFDDKFGERVRDNTQLELAVVDFSKAALEEGLGVQIDQRIYNNMIDPVIKEFTVAAKRGNFDPKLLNNVVGKRKIADLESSLNILVKNEGKKDITRVLTKPKGTDGVSLTGATTKPLDIKSFSAGKDIFIPMTPDLVDKVNFDDVKLVGTGRDTFIQVNNFKMVLKFDNSRKVKDTGKAQVQDITAAVYTYSIPGIATPFIEKVKVDQAIKIKDGQRQLSFNNSKFKTFEKDFTLSIGDKAAFRFGDVLVFKNHKSATALVKAISRAFRVSKDEGGNSALADAFTGQMANLMHGLGFQFGNSATTFAAQSISEESQKIKVKIITEQFKKLTAKLNKKSQSNVSKVSNVLVRQAEAKVKNHVKEMNKVIGQINKINDEIAFSLEIDFLRDPARSTGSVSRIQGMIGSINVKLVPLFLGSSALNAKTIKLEKLLSAITRKLVKDLEANVLNIKGSPSFIQLVRKMLRGEKVSPVSTKFKKVIRPPKLKKLPKVKLNLKQFKPKNVSRSRSNKVNVGKIKLLASAAVAKEAKKEAQQRIDTKLPLLSLKTTINEVLAQTLKKVMPSKNEAASKEYLRYQTGRFAKSATIEDLASPGAKRILATYSYLSDPYSKYEGQGGRDPRKIITEAIDIIWADLLKDKFNLDTRRV